MKRNVQDHNHMKHIFGPVPSRRLGFSLGIDVVPFKTCSYDCIYCQLGRTTDKTIKREEFIPIAEIISELKHALRKNRRIDYITLSGSGEPTLHSRLDELINGIKRLTDIPIAVLTNGSLLWDKEVRYGLRNADLIVPSLDAGDEDMFQYVNRPCPELSFEKVVNGIIAFSKLQRKKIWLEVFLLNGVTAIQAEVLKINSIIKSIRPVKVQLNTVNRPPAESFAFAVPDNQMKELAAYFEGEVEIISDFEETTNDGHFKASETKIINLLKRRPCSLADIAGGLNLHKNEILKYIGELAENNVIVYHEHNHILYYSVKEDA